MSAPASTVLTTSLKGRRDAHTAATAPLHAVLETLRREGPRTFPGLVDRLGYAYRDRRLVGAALDRLCELRLVERREGPRGRWGFDVYAAAGRAR